MFLTLFLPSKRFLCILLRLKIFTWNFRLNARYKIVGRRECCLFVAAVVVISFFFSNTFFAFFFIIIVYLSQVNVENEKPHNSLFWVCVCVFLVLPYNYNLYMLLLRNGIFCSDIQERRRPRKKVSFRCGFYVQTQCFCGSTMWHCVIDACVCGMRKFCHSQSFSFHWRKTQ